MSSKDGKVLIKKEAFRNMITHVLRFGSEDLAESVEVMGLCLGKTNGKDIELINAIPITHGKTASSGFSSEDYNLFLEIEKRYAPHNLNIVGWYASHPGWGLFFSDNAIKNHLFFQKESNSNGFHIVFDHTLMGKEGSLGFDIYRLNNFKEGDDHHQVSFELELPNSLKYFQWVVKFMEDSQKKSPILIKEIKELAEPSPDDLQEIPKPDEPLPEADKFDDFPEITPITAKIQEGFDIFSKTFTETLKSQLGNWTQSVKRGSLKGSDFLKNSTHLMKEKVSHGISKIENWISINLDEIVNKFQENVSHNVNLRMKAQKDMIEQTSNMKGSLMNNINNMLGGNLSDVIKQIEIKLNDFSEKITQSGSLSSQKEELLNKTSEHVSKISGVVNEFSHEIDNMNDISSIEQTFNNQIEGLESGLNKIREIYSQISNSLSKLQEIHKLSDKI
jgi:proteasome lid subunit RPN8/RPN11